MSWRTVELSNDLYTYEYFLAENVCRLCWCQNGLKEITSRPSEDVETNVTIAEMIHECIGIDLSINPRPTKICFSCLNEVENFCDFRSFCFATQSKLYDKLQIGSQEQVEPDQTNDESKLHDYTHDSNGFSDLEYSAINNLFEDLNNESVTVETLPVLKRKKRKKIKPETYCAQCKTDLGSQDMLTQHNADIHAIEKSLFKCFGCDRVFKNRKGCLRHETEFCKALKNGYKCNICGKFLQKRVTLEIHLRAHREDDVDLPLEEFQCKKCVKQFVSMELLNEHMTVHKTDTNNWVCDVSTKLSTSVAQLHSLI